MFIAIHATGMPFNGSTIPKGESLGGSESAAYYMAKELSALGHRVYVFTNSKASGSWDGVNYEWAGPVTSDSPMGERFDFVMNTPFDVLVCQRHPLAFAKEYNTKLNIWWLHDLALKRYAGHCQGSLVNVDKIFTVSEFHKQQVADVYTIEPEHIIATKNGVDYSQFAGVEDFPREARSLIFASRPERGLAELIDQGGIMEKLPDCRLYVCGYNNTVPQMEGLYNYLWGRCKELPNVENLGPLGKRDLYELMARSMLYVYPTTFEDTSNIVAMESNAAGTPFIGVQNAALPETIGHDGAILLPLKDGRVDQDLFVLTIKKVLADRSKWDNLHNKAVAKRQSWADIAKEWETTFENLLAEKSMGDTHRLAKHLIRQSDIIALNHLFKGDVAEIEKHDPHYRRDYGFFINNDYAGYYDRYYQYEADRGVNYGPENMGNIPRFQAILEKVKEIKAKRILDYGCAHGPVMMNLAARYPDAEYVGYDINQKNIDIGREWAEKDFPAAEFRLGTHNAIEGEYDCILATEVLEHVPDPAEVVEALKKHLTPDGIMIITVPYGRWESLGYEAHPGWRAHIHHFERADLLEMFGKQPGYKLLAMPTNNFLGHFFFTFTNSDIPLGRIDYERKLRQQAPRETVSLCMIVKNGGLTLGKCLSEVRSHIDEIIIGIDETTKDNTREIAESFGAKCITIPSPLKIGFDEARNLTIRQASMNWIMWLDDDEHLKYADEIYHYLRPNCYGGYAVPQHHYAVEPAALFKTDLPVRLFRNKKDIRFFGFVHEHPSREKDINEGVGRVHVLPKIGIMHIGYGTEAIRRDRFARNWPLIQEDRKKYPDRHLGKMLWVRDLAHMIKYKLEKNNGQPFPEMRGYAKEIIEDWLELIRLKAGRMAIEALPYYSEAVSVLGVGGLEYDFSFDMIMGQNGSSANRNANNYHGLFLNGDHIRQFTGMLVDESAKRFEGKYV